MFLMKIPEVHVEVETSRIINKLGFASSEFLGASAESLKDSLIIYKTLLDWIRSKSWHLSEQDIQDIESALQEKLPKYSPTRFGGDRTIQPTKRSGPLTKTL